ncbi:uncharacterized protein [Oryza sativa Japonica Group]|jgi:hypothetical protein|uniref:Os02g0151400 protein n=3 Tax=Oryza sativa TaxID=4530 RepID=A0A0P0VF16_ORYSJ|nr:uncharacterized protein LOC4328317 [Oryza sativa Japonica Group]EEC72501.1 hypothetical protein OsI_05875 [Oryza sativa Indica Group]KAB8085882.1 hypothetical protein EE612_008897 [Oryza sativa]EEE56314.1 hypothetical protein OsJ_05400 [Oryza sativa Japonica Group]KAF2943107.1 hypothetical protein DAI22_02g041400 [Oryza sativa Japonica Group]BAD38056.1 unknown protein [Oryza sativa Japonica Group]|eukprot:NP_001045908.1 Os02g0151400 [Oryza sativa Japonica Group]
MSLLRRVGRRFLAGDILSSEASPHAVGRLFTEPPLPSPLEGVRSPSPLPLPRATKQPFIGIFSPFKSYPLQVIRESLPLAHHQSLSRNAIGPSYRWPWTRLTSAVALPKLLGTRWASTNTSSTTGFGPCFTSAGELIDALTYARANPLMRKVKIMGREDKIIWIPNDNLRRLVRSLNKTYALLHAKKKCLSSLTSSNVLVGEDGSAVIQGVIEIPYSEEEACCRYNETASILKELITESVGSEAIGVDCIADFRRLLRQMESMTSVCQEYIISNHASLIPDANRTAVFLLFYNHIMGKLAQEQPRLKNQIISKLPYDGIWLGIVISNRFLRRWLNSHREYVSTGDDDMSFNWNVRSHFYVHLWIFAYSQLEVEECLYGEFPELLLEIEILLWKANEIDGLGFEDKF